MKKTLLVIASLLLFSGCGQKTDKPASNTADTPKTADAAAEPAKADDGSAAKADADKADSGDVKPDAGADKDAPAPELPKAEQPALAGDSLLKTAKDNGTPAVEGTVCDEPEGCDCNGTKCPMNAVCGDTCICGNKEVPPDAGYECIEIAKNVYDLGCTEKDGWEGSAASSRARAFMRTQAIQKEFVQPELL